MAVAFFHHPDLIWARVVKKLYGLDGQDAPLIPKRSWSGPWNGIYRMIANLNDRGFDFHTLCPIRIGIRLILLFGMMFGWEILCLLFHSI